jgi:integrase
VNYNRLQVAEALDRWIDLSGQEPGGLLQPTRTGKVWVRSGQCMTRNALFKALERLAKESGLKDFSPHDLRRSWHHLFKDLGLELFGVANHLGQFFSPPV